MMAQYTMVIEDAGNGYLMAEVLELPGCRTQAKTKDDLVLRMREAISLFLEMQGSDVKRKYELERIDVKA